MKKKITNEIKIMRTFIIEFCPFYTDEMVKGMRYEELKEAIKDIAEEL